MKLKKVISGGQTGADRTGLECAKALGLETGGMAPKGYRTEKGPDPSLKDFGLIESMDAGYPTRTRHNARYSDCTVWFGNTNSPGYYCTKKACTDWGKSLFANPSPEKLVELANAYEVWNIAGNRESTNPAVVDLVKAAFKALK